MGKDDARDMVREMLEEEFPHKVCPVCDDWSRFARFGDKLRCFGCLTVFTEKLEQV